MKVPEPRRLKSGTWFIQLRLGGESISVSAATAKECRRQASLIKAEFQAGKREISRIKTELTLSAAIDKYIDERKNSLSPLTIRGYRIIQKNRFKAYMDLPLRSIRDWQAVYDAEKNLIAPKTLKNAFAFLRSVYKAATGREMPAVDVLPTVTHPRPFLDYVEITAFMAALRGKRCELPALLALHSLRVSELLDLTWENVDLKKNTIEVAGATVPDENNKLVHKDPNKTEKSRRLVPIFIPRLSELLEAREDKTGKVVSYAPNSLYNAINTVCDRAGLPKVGTHGLRHSFVSLCVHLHIPEETTMKLGGWSDFQTMHKIYTHIAERDLAAHVDALRAFYESVPAALSETADTAAIPVAAGHENKAYTVDLTAAV